MPYTKPESQKYIMEGGDPRDVGELNLKITLELLRRWKETPRYETIHKLSQEFSVYPFGSAYLGDLKRMNQRFTFEDVETASQEAFAEFRRRVVSLYENIKADMNGDVYAEAVKDLRDLRAKEIPHVLP